MLQNDAQVSPLGMAPTQASLRSRRLKMVRVLVMLGAPAGLLIALTVQGWDQVLQTENTALRVHKAVQRSLRVAALITDLQVERGRTAMLLNINQSLNDEPHKQLLVNRKTSDIKARDIQDWSFINMQTISNTTRVQQQHFAGYLTWIRGLIDIGAANMTFTLDTYTSVIKSLISSLLSGLEDEEQHIYLPAFHTFMMAGDKVGLMRARGSAIWVSCDDSQTARSEITRDLAQYMALMEVGVHQSPPLRAAFDKVGLDIKVMVKELEYGITYLISDTFEHDCRTTTVEGRIQDGDRWFQNMTAYIKRISYVREAFIVALQKTIDDLMYGIKTMALVYAFIIVLTIFCTIGSAFAAFNSVRTALKLHEMSRLLTEKRQEVEIERSRCHNILSQMLPATIADQLKNKGTVEPEYFKDVTILFSNIAESQSISSYHSPDQAIGFLNSLQEIFDQGLKRYDVGSVHTIGHAWMLISGLPIRNGDTHAWNIAHLALYIQKKTKLQSIWLRIGIHSGPCMAGIIGNTAPRYCVFGDTVNTALKIEASGYGAKIHISEGTNDRLNRAGGFVTSPNTTMDLQEKLKMKTYWLEAKTGPSTGNRSEVMLVPNDRNSAWPTA